MEIIKARFDKVALIDRLPDMFYLRLVDRLSLLWKERFHNDDSQFTLMEETDLRQGHCYYNHYYKVLSLLFTLEQLRKTNIIPKSFLFDSEGKINSKSTAQECDEMFMRESNDGILKDLNVGVIGGPEGEIFAALGADAVSIDPFLDLAPKHNRPNYIEISQPLSNQIVAQYTGQFDLTWSNNLFDSDNEVYNYKQLFELVYRITKPGGISVYQGNEMPNILKGINEGKFKFIGGAKQFKNFDWVSSYFLVALKKLS